MDNLCNNCGVCCRLIPVDTENKFLLSDGLQKLDNVFIDFLEPLSIEDAQSINDSYVSNVQNIFPNAKFFSCKYLSECNICTNLKKHEFCETFPSHPLALIPSECTYYGEFFIKSEEIKQKIRKYKEEIVYYESMIASGCKEERAYHKIIDSLNRFIEKYAPYGSEIW